MKNNKSGIFWACLLVFCHTTFLILTITVLVSLKKEENALLYLCLLIGFSCELLGWLVTSIIYLTRRNSEQKSPMVETYETHDPYQQYQQGPPFGY